MFNDELLWMVAKIFASPTGWLKPKQNNGMFTTVFNWCRISLAHPPYESNMSLTLFSQHLDMDRLVSSPSSPAMTAFTWPGKAFEKLAVSPV